MKHIITFILVSILFTAYPQQITFQGKLFENNQPVTGNRSVEFFIGNPINWTETHSVQINNGLYAVVLGSINPLPLNLFTSTVNSRELVVRINSNPVDTVTIYAPFERDYTVPDYIKDGISWSEISNKPNVDTSNTNELQTLSISNNVLSISQGNSVTLPSGTGGSSQNLTVYGNLTVLDTVPSLSLSQPAYSTIGTVVTAWQSFIATTNGHLRQIKLWLSVSCNNYVRVEVYNGVGNGGQSLGWINVNGLNNQMGWRTLDISGVNPPITLQSGNTYTFAVTAPNGCNMDVRYMNPGSYQYGYSSFGVASDLAFELYTDNSSPPCLTFSNNCYVGIGTNLPTSQLTVAGRIKDQTGFVSPVGSITAFAGRTAPEGWLLCDGSPISRISFSELFSVIDTSWGNGDGATTFNLPDLRGRFLRGVDGSANNDPDKNSRTVTNPGGNAGNNVGSLQGDMVHKHTHCLEWGGNGTGGDLLPQWSSNTGNSNINNYCRVGWGTGDGTSDPSGPISYVGEETRPKNANVHYIIKY